MRVFENPDNTTCAIMSEETNHNGTGLEAGCSSNNTGPGKTDLSPTGVGEYNDTNVCTGGTLKFFQDGKFILELSHRREGDKTSWVSVPKKTYWPPSVTAMGATNCVRQQGSPCLSVSDDNSSVQSSPCQRDHCWKQTNPRKVVNSEMTFIMCPLSRALIARHNTRLRKLRRRPYVLMDLSDLPVEVTTRTTTTHRRNRAKPGAMKSGELSSLVERLFNSVKLSENVHSVQKQSSSIFSPRKRILRELEKVNLATNSVEEHQNHLSLKRQRSKVNGTRSKPRVSSPQTPASKGLPYSIMSLLGTKEENNMESESSFLRTLLKSPSQEVSPEPSPKSRKSSPSQQRVKSPSPPAYCPPGPSVHYPQSIPSAVYPPFLPSTFIGVPGPYRNPLFDHYPLSSLPRGGSYPGLFNQLHPPPFGYPWAPTLAPSATHETKRANECSDLPLNLSKHTG